MTHDALRKRVAMAIWQATPDTSSSAATIAADAAIRVVAQAMQEVSDEMCADACGPLSLVAPSNPISEDAEEVWRVMLAASPLGKALRDDR